jgi:hypothetical protein
MTFSIFDSGNLVASYDEERRPRSTRSEHGLADRLATIVEGSVDRRGRAGGRARTARRCAD